MAPPPHIAQHSQPATPPPRLAHATGAQLSKITAHLCLNGSSIPQLSTQLPVLCEGKLHLQQLALAATRDISQTTGLLLTLQQDTHNKHARVMSDSDMTSLQNSNAASTHVCAAGSAMLVSTTLQPNTTTLQPTTVAAASPLS